MAGKVLILGATGVVGNAALAHVVRAGWDAIGVSRREPECVAGSFLYLPVDLTDRTACAEAFGDLRDITHGLYAALFEKPGLIQGWRESDQMQTNLAMLQNVLDPLLKASTQVRHITLFHGCVDTQSMFARLFTLFRARKILPPRLDGRVDR